MAGDDDDCARCVFRHGIRFRISTAVDDLFDEALSTILHASVEMCGGTEKPDKVILPSVGMKRPKNFRNLS
jgi:hypothetical protein